MYLAIAAALTFGLSACGSDGGATGSGAEAKKAVFNPATATDQEKWDQYVRLVTKEGIPKKRWVASNAVQAMKPGYHDQVCGRTLNQEVGGLDLMGSVYTKEELRQMSRGTVLYDQVYCPEKAEQAEEAWTKHAAEAKAKPKAADFTIKVKIRSKQCFGSAGCNITFQISPGYSGPSDLSGSYDVTYQVTGVEDGPMINTFSLTNGNASFDSEEMASTSSSSDKLTARVIRVDKG